MLNMRSASRDTDDSGDLTARASIRNTALRLFADHGHDAVSVRRIAAEAGVSPALVLHHFGSKAGLREAVDAWAAAHLDAFAAGSQDGSGEAGGLSGEGAAVAEALAGGDDSSVAEVFAHAFPPDSPLPAYVRRLLLSGDPAGIDLFRRWFEVSRTMLAQMDAAGITRPTQQPDVRAAFMLASDVAVLVLREPLTAALGFDPLSPEGLTRWAAEVSAITRGGLLRPPPPEADPAEPAAPDDEPHEHDDSNKEEQ